MRLKAFTSTMLIFGLLLLAGWPWIIGSQPRDPALLRAYTIRFGVYFIVLLIVFATTAFCAILLARRAREEYRDQIRDNLQSLIEGALRDQQRDGAEKRNEP